MIAVLGITRWLRQVNTEVETHTLVLASPIQVTDYLLGRRDACTVEELLSLSFDELPGRGGVFDLQPTSRASHCLLPGGSTAWKVRTRSHAPDRELITSNLRFVLVFPPPHPRISCVRFAAGTPKAAVNYSIFLFSKYNP